MTINVTALDAANTSIEWIQAVNDIALRIPVHGGLLVFFMILVSLGTIITNDFRKALLASSTASAVFSLILVFAKLCSWYFPFVFAAGIITGIVLLQDKDYR